MAVCAVFKVFTQDRVQQRRLSLWNAFLSGMWSRSLILQCLVEAFKIFVLDRVQWLRPLLRTFQLVPWTSRFTGFFALFLPEKKFEVGSALGSELSADFISSTPSAYEVPHFSEYGNFFFEDDKKTWMRLPSGWWYLLCSEPGEYRVDPRVPMG